MRNHGLVSIITPNYCCGEFLAECIRSVQAQTYGEWEMIIVDDCSTDDSLRVIEEFAEKDGRIRVLVNERNSGAALSRNRALREARGRWIAFLDSDDLWMPEKLERQLDFMVDNGYHFSYHTYREMDSDGQDTGVRISGPRHVTRRRMYDFCWMGCLTVMYDREHVGLIQIADIKKNNDYAMWLKVCQRADCHLLNRELACYRRGREGSVSTTGYATLIKWHYRLFRDAEGMGPIAAICHTMRNLMWGVYKKLRYKTKLKE